MPGRGSEPIELRLQTLNIDVVSRAQRSTLGAARSAVLRVVRCRPGTAPDSVLAATSSVSVAVPDPRCTTTRNAVELVQMA